MTELQTTEEFDIKEFTWDSIIESIDTEDLSTQDVEALSYLLVGYSIPESATMAGMSASTLRRHLKENSIMQEALTHKKKLMLALMLNKFQKQMLTALKLSNDFLLREPTEEGEGLSKSETAIYLKQITHAEFIINKFMDLMKSNPLEGLNIKHEGDGDVSLIVLNVAGTSALDYLKKGMSKQRPLIQEKPSAEFVSNVPMLDERGLPPYGTFGNWTYDEKGNIICHICGASLGSKQAMYGHIGTHNVNAETYKKVYNVLWDEIE
ncbi:MAG TPA: hypothetical protein ENG48_11120 [Candidatus Atribacteria bacterium]|nr:hypothetical protein [Candidatus Atribacteria bacterium]